MYSALRHFAQTYCRFLRFFPLPVHCGRHARRTTTWAWRTGILCCLLPPLLSFAAVNAATISLNGQVAGIEGFYGSLTSLKFGFQQMSHSGGSQRLGSGTGMLFKERGGEWGKTRAMMRWDYQEPERQVIISDGDTLSIYSPEDQQMIVSSAAQLETDMLYRLFLRERQLLADFSVSAADQRDGALSEGLRALRLTPRQPHPQIREVVLWFDTAYRVQRLRMLDQFGGETRLIFGQIEENPLAGSSPEHISQIFQFIPPEGTEIIHN